jgi:thiamine biosynthesis lipoprotein ApbE
VLAPTATMAELLSTAFFVLGAEKAADYCAAHPEISAVLAIPSNEVPDLKFGNMKPLGELCIVELGNNQ